MRLLTLTVIGLVTTLTGCASLQVSTPAPPPVPTDGRIAVVLDRVEHGDEAQLEKYQQAVQIVEEVINSDAFRTMVLRGPETQRPIRDGGEPQTAACADGLTTYTWNVVDGECLDNAAVYSRLTASTWRLSVAIEPTWYALRCGWPFVNEIGHRSGDQIVTKSCHFNDMNEKELAGHLIHEYSHLLGFGHPRKKSGNRPRTVPYFIGDHVVDIASDLEAAREMASINSD